MDKFKLKGSGLDTFSDNLVGRQITDGSSLMTDTNFTINKTIPTKENKKFKTEKFSDFVTLDDITDKEIIVDNINVQDKSKKIKFINDSSNGAISLFGSLSSRVLSAISLIIEQFPYGFYVDSEKINRDRTTTAYDVIYSPEKNYTQFTISLGMISNDTGLEIINVTQNENGFWNNYKNYVLLYENNTYDIVDFTHLKNNNEIILKVKGKPFTSEIEDNFLVKPNEKIVSKFFDSLDEMETILLNRETTPIYTSSFKMPSENDDGMMIMVNRKVTWPINNDGYNISINGINYRSFIEDLLAICDSIDNYKSNLFVRFMSAPQLYEFDSEDKKIESVFQIYGQNFDNIKQYINNIAFMRNVSYNKLNNIPDQFLKSLLKTLGLKNIPTIGDNSNEYDVYRRLIVNLPHLFKAKGTRKPIEFLLKFIGAPDPLIRINEEVYEVTEIPLINDLDDKIYDLIAGTYEEEVVTYNEITELYEVNKVKKKINYNRDGYPIKENSYKPNKSFSKKDDIFFQKGAGWYKPTLDHKSVEVIDTENSDLTSSVKTIVTKQKEFTYGEDYFDVFRTLPGLDRGFELNTKIDNTKSDIKEENLILNRKNISIFLSPSHLFDYIFHIKMDEDVTGIEDTKLSGKYKVTDRFSRSYYGMGKLYEEYLYNGDDNPNTLHNLLSFTNSLSNDWVNLIEQFIPATTLWCGGNLISNGVLGRDKFTYKKSSLTEEVCDFDNASFTLGGYCLFNNGYITYDSLPCVFNSGNIDFVSYNENGGVGVLDRMSNSCDPITLINVISLDDTLRFEWSFGEDYYDTFDLEIAYDDGIFTTIKTISGSPITSTNHTVTNIDITNYSSVKGRITMTSHDCGTINSNIINIK